MAGLKVLQPSDPATAHRRVQCPSARPDMPGTTAFGVIQGSVGQPRVAFLERAVPATQELLALSGPVEPTEVFRFAAPCAGNACRHFDGTDCSLATRIVQRLPAVVDDPPDCAIRPACRWWLQEGVAACLRCPLVVTESYGAAEISEELRIAADPATPVGP